jgi:hypothetical protein
MFSGLALRATACSRTCNDFNEQLIRAVVHYTSQWLTLSFSDLENNDTRWESGGHYTRLVLLVSANFETRSPSVVAMSAAWEQANCSRAKWGTAGTVCMWQQVTYGTEEWGKIGTACRWQQVTYGTEEWGKLGTACRWEQVTYGTEEWGKLGTIYRAATCVLVTKCSFHYFNSGTCHYCGMDTA